MLYFKILGVWKDRHGKITHYAALRMATDSPGKAVRLTKSEAIALVENTDYCVTTAVWDYKKARWRAGKSVGVVTVDSIKYSRSCPDQDVQHKLGHLIDYEWVLP